MKLLNVLSFDPSLSNWGIAYIQYSPDTFDVIATDIIQTKPIKKSKLSKAQQDLLRIDELYAGIQLCLEDVDVIVIELPIGSQTARAAVGYGACLALVASLPLPRLYVSPGQVKKVVGKHTTTKEEIIEWVDNLHPATLHPTKSKAEHQADAVVAAYAALPQLRSFYANTYPTTT